jgi:uncharacterized protein YbjT (DUF2867 family)
MQVVIFGATGMIGQGVLRECLLDPTIDRVVTVGRAATGAAHSKLHEIVRADLSHLDDLAGDLSDLDACFYCLGVTSVGTPEADYTRITYDLTIAAAGTLCSRSPQMTFVFVSGAGADSTEKGTVMWARVKGRTENAVLRLPFRASYVFRPGAVQPVHGVRSRTRWYQAIYTTLGPVMSLARRLAPSRILTTEQIGRAMIRVAATGAPKRVLEAPDIYAALT